MRGDIDTAHGDGEIDLAITVGIPAQGVMVETKLSRVPREAVVADEVKRLVPALADIGINAGQIDAVVAVEVG